MSAPEQRARFQIQAHCELGEIRFGEAIERASAASKTPADHGDSERLCEDVLLMGINGRMNITSVWARHQAKSPQYSVQTVRKMSTSSWNRKEVL